MAITDKELAFSLRKMSRCQKAFIDKRLAGVGAHIAILRVLHCFNEEDTHLNQVQIAEKLNVSPPQITVNIKKMVEQGILEKVPSQKDLRYNQITLTPLGKDLKVATTATMSELESKLFLGFTDEEKELFYDFSERVIQNIKVRLEDD